MKYVLVIAALLWAAFVPAATLNERLAELNNDADVLEAVQVGDPAQVGGGFAALWTVSFDVAWTSGDVAKKSKIALIGISHGTQEEAWYWAIRVPEPLTNAVVEYMDGNQNGPYTATEAEAFCNTKWAGVVSSPAPIKNFQLQRLDGLTVQVSGLFNVPGDDLPWQQRSYILRFPASNSTLAQIVFERTDTN